MCSPTCAGRTAVLTWLARGALQFCRLAVRAAAGIWILTVAQGVLAQTVVEIGESDLPIDLTPHLQYHLDPEHRWTPEQAHPVDWVAMSAKAPDGNFGHVEATLWVRAALRSKTERHLDLRWSVAGTQLNTATIRVERAGHRPQITESGLAGIASQSRGSHRMPVAAIALAPGEAVHVLMQVRGNELIQVPVTLWTAEQWTHHDRGTTAVLGGYFGLALALLTYNAFLAVRLREVAYVHYVNFGSALTVFQLVSTGFGPLFLWPPQALWSNHILTLAVAWLGASSLRFADSFLRLGTINPRVSRAIRSLSWAWALPVLAMPLLPLHALTEWFSLPLALITALSLIATGIYAVRQRLPAATYFLIGWGGIALAGCFRVLLRLGVLPTHPTLYHALLMAGALEMVLLSMGLADRVITERKARALAESQRAREQAAREAAQNSLQMKSNFMAAIAHDLRQPNYALRLAVDNLERRGSEQTNHPALDQMRSALRYSDELLTSLGLVAQLDAGAVDVQRTPFAVGHLLERVEARFWPETQQRKLAWNVRPSLLWVHTDPTLLERMVTNLVANAVRYTDQGGVMLCCRQRRDHCLIQVWDTGRGIEPEEQARVFETHWRGSNVRHGDQGLGLGLSIVQRCAELLGIGLSLRSVAGRGSCFSLWVPALDVQDHPRDAAMSPLPPAVPHP
jgi:two-component system, sensor histidine kinase LadS